MSMATGVPVSINTPQRTIDSWVTPVWLNHIRAYLGHDLYAAIETEIETPTARATALWGYLVPLVSAIAIKNTVLYGAAGLEMLGFTNTVSTIAEGAGSEKRKAAAELCGQNETSAYVSLRKFLDDNAATYPEYAPTANKPQNMYVLKGRITTNW